MDHGREKLPEQFQALATNIGREDREPSNIPTRVCEACDQACANWITREHDDRDGRGRTLRRMGGRRVEGHDDVYFEPHELSGEVVEAIDLSSRRQAIFDPDILPLGIPELSKSLAEPPPEEFWCRDR